MPKTDYHLSLKGYVGGWDFNRSDVDDVLASNAGKHVDVLIDSLGGSLATGLSISAAFKNHGDVSVHFVGMNASAATIASLGAKHISIDAGAMYLVHQCSTSFWEWGSLNSDQFSTLIKDCEKIKADLDKLDLNCAQLYAARCKRKTEDLLALMKEGGWLTAKEALAWGFVDEITDFADEPAPTLTDALASAMASEGLPIPNMPLAKTEKGSLISRLFAAMSEALNPAAKSITNPMNKTYSFLCAAIGLQALSLSDNKASLTDEQLSKIEAELKSKNDALAAKDAKITELQAKLDAKPAEATSNVVEVAKPEGKPEAKNAVEAYVASVNSAQKLFNEV